MHSPSGGGWSFKKNGRVDAAFVRFEGTNVILLSAVDGTYRVVPATSLSEDDRTYARRADAVFATGVPRMANEQRTWTFSQDGTMHSPSGDGWSFKKNGRLDAAFARLEGTNVILVSAVDGQYRAIPITSFSEDDRTYLRTACSNVITNYTVLSGQGTGTLTTASAKGISESEAVNIKETAAGKSAEASAPSFTSQSIERGSVQGRFNLPELAGMIGSQLPKGESASYYAREILSGVAAYDPSYELTETDRQIIRNMAHLLESPR